jgi:hypothetical protein
MRQVLPIVVLVCLAWLQAWGQPRNEGLRGTAIAAAPQSATDAAKGETVSAPAVSPDQANAHKAKALIDQAIQALGGQAYLTIRDVEQQGRLYSFHHGRESGGGVFWSFAEFPDKERVEVTKERDIAELYVGDKAWELTFKGARPIEEKERSEYVRRRHFSLETVLRTWVNDPGVVLLSEGMAIAAQHPSEQVTLINTQNESVTLYFDSETHLPVKKSFTWRDPVDKQKNLEEEVYENYRAVSGIQAPYNVTRYFNGDMARQRFLNSVTINQGLDQAMFDPHSGYNPNKQPEKKSSKR